MDEEQNTTIPEPTAQFMREIAAFQKTLFVLVLSHRHVHGVMLDNICRMVRGSQIETPVAHHRLFLAQTGFTGKLRLIRRCLMSQPRNLRGSYPFITNGRASLRKGSTYQEPKVERRDVQPQMRVPNLFLLQAPP